MSDKRKKPKNRYPSPRLKGMGKLFQIIQEELDWKPNSITGSKLKTLDIAKGRETEAVFTLKFLGLIDDNGIPTSDFDKLRNDFSKTLSELTITSYKGLFDTIPKNMIRQTTLVNFFMQEGYSRDTAEYQAKFFAWLCEQSDIRLPNIETGFKRARFEKDR